MCVLLQIGKQDAGRDVAELSRDIVSGFLF